jgi:uncharacterized membrane protein HdeD (DUF308 family)
MASAAADPKARREPPMPCANWSWFALRGGLAILLGIAAISFPVTALFAFTLLFAAYATVDGIFTLVSGVRGARRSEERWWTLILRGLVGIAIGAIFLLMPGLATIGYAVASLALLAAWALVTGAFELSAAIRLRREIEGEWLLGLSGLLSILLGIAIPFILLLYPLITILSVAWIIGAYALISGVALVVQAIRLNRRRQAGAA